MTRWRLALGLAASLALTGCGSSESEGTGPFIDEVLPASAPRGGSIEILGEGLCGDGIDAVATDGSCTTPPSGFVSLGADTSVVRATVESWKSERITLTVPQQAQLGATVLVVTVDGIASNAVDFEVSQ